VSLDAKIITLKRLMSKKDSSVIHYRHVTEYAHVKAVSIMATVLEDLVFTHKGTTSQPLIKQFISTRGILEQALRHRTHILGKHRCKISNPQHHMYLWVPRTCFKHGTPAV
jgi:hypothetical protein